MISDYVLNVKQWGSENKKDLFLAALIFLTSMASFGLGRLSTVLPEKEPIMIQEAGIAGAVGERGDARDDSASAPAPSSTQQKYVASKTGTAYHYAWCPGAKKIKESNKIWFETREEAERKGYKPAANCPGL